MQNTEQTTIMVPYAEDGSFFHPGLKNERPRARDFLIGGKKIESKNRISDYAEALIRLSRMGKARWWRANKKGAPGAMVEDGWMPLPEAYLSMLSRESIALIRAVQEAEKLVAPSKDLGTSLCTNPNPTPPAEWSEEALEKVVEAYRAMLAKCSASESFDLVADLMELQSELSISIKEIEKIFEAISFVLRVHGRNWLTGCDPAISIDKETAELLELIYAVQEDENMESLVAAEIDAMALRTGIEIIVPEGNRTPERKTAPRPQYERGIKVKETVLKWAAGVCEVCDQPAPFINTAGVPYLHTHHVKFLRQESTSSTKKQKSSKSQHKMSDSTSRPGYYFLALFSKPSTSNHLIT